MKNVLEVIERGIHLNPEANSYRAQLQKTGLPGPDIQKAVLKKVVPPEIDAANIKISRQAMAQIQEAMSVGLDTIPTVVKAAKTASLENRKKIGLFGNVGRTLVSIKHKIESQRQKKQQDGASMVLKKHRKTKS